MCWTAVAFTMVPIAGSGIFEYISLVGIQAGYVEVINQYRHAAQKGTPGRKLEEAQLADEQLTERAVRKWLKKRFIFYLLLTIAIIGVSAVRYGWPNPRRYA